MKKIAILFILIIVSFPISMMAQQQKEHFFREPTVGVMLPYFAAHNFGQTPPFTKAWNIAPSINVLTAKTHDHLMYDCDANSVETLNGWLLKRNWDIYNFLSKSLSTKDAYGSIGIEKVLVLANNVDVVFFAEVGTNFFGVQSASLGIVFHPQLSLKKQPKGKG